jgi:DNA-binding XRE family transcriptional regulator
MDLKDYHSQRMQDPNVAVAQRKLQPKLDLGRQIRHLRLEHGWTQKELAGKAGTKQANISRLQNGLLNPSIGA